MIDDEDADQVLHTDVPESPELLARSDIVRAAARRACVHVATDQRHRRAARSTDRSDRQLAEEIQDGCSCARSR